MVKLKVQFSVLQKSQRTGLNRSLLAVLAGQWSKLEVIVSGLLTVSKPSMTAK